MPPTLRHTRRVLSQTSARFVQVLPAGLRLDDDGPIRPSCLAEIVSFGDARTYYRCRQPICRSLDGVRSATDPARQCGCCLDSKHCVEQILVEIYVERMPYRLLLAFTSAKNFLKYVAQNAAKKVALDATPTRISVKARGHWGELVFAAVVPSPRA